MTTAAQKAALAAVAADARAKAQATRDAVAALPVEDPPAPAQAIATFTADRLSITAGEAVVLSWGTTNASAVRLNGETVPAASTRSFAPTADTTYTLEVDGSAPTIRQSLTVTVTAAPAADPPPIVSIPVNVSALVGLVAQVPPDRYRRFETALVLTRAELGIMHSDGVTFLPGLPFHKVNVGAGGFRRSMLYPKYGLLVNGAERATVDFGAHTYTLVAVSVNPPTYGTATFTKNEITYTPKVAYATQISYTLEDDVTKARTSGTEIAIATTAQQRFAINYPTQGVFSGSLADEGDGHAKFELVAYDTTGKRVTAPGESLMTFWGTINRTGGAKDLPDVIKQTGSYEWTHIAPTYAYVRVPKAMLPNRARPLTPKDAIPFDTALPASKIERVALLPSIAQADNQTHFPVRHASGLVTTDNAQAYETSPMYSKLAAFPHYDGPRGIAKTAYPTMLRNGRNGKVYGFDPQSMYVVDATGTKRTLRGKVHRGLAPYGPEADATGNDQTTIVGECIDPTVPANEHFPLSCWGFEFVPSTLEVDLSAPEVGGEPPHKGIGPRGYDADGHGFINESQFNGGGPEGEALFGNKDRAAPVKWRRAIQSNDPWGIAIAARDGKEILFHAERRKHRVPMHDTATFPPTYLGDAYTPPENADALCYFDDWPKNNPLNAAHLRPGVTLAQARAVGMPIAPEIIRILDDYLYVSSNPQQAIWRMNLLSKVWEPSVFLERPWQYDDKSKFVYFDISDGSFGPRHTLFVSTFSNVNRGFPLAFLPVAGNSVGGSPVTHSKPWAYYADPNDTNYIGATRGPKNSENSSYAMAMAVSHGFMSSGASEWGLDKFQQTSDAPPDFAKLQRGHKFYRDNFLFLIWGSDGYQSSYPAPYGLNGDLDYWLNWHGVTP